MIITTTDMGRFLNDLLSKNLIEKFRIIEQKKEKGWRIFIESEQFEFVFELLRENIVKGSPISVDAWPKA